MNIYGVVDAKTGQYFDISKTERGAKMAANNRGFTAVYRRNVNHYHIEPVAFKPLNKWIPASKFDAHLVNSFGDGKTATISEFQDQALLIQGFDVWDNGGESLDRFTVVARAQEKDRRGFFECLTLCDTGAGVNMFADCQKGSHLGKKRRFDTLPESLQNIIINRFCGV